MHDLDVEDSALDLAGDDTIVEVGLAVLQAGGQGPTSGISPPGLSAADPAGASEAEIHSTDRRLFSDKTNEPTRPAGR